MISFIPVDEHLFKEYAIPWLGKLLPGEMIKTIRSWRLQKKPAISDINVDYVYSHYRGQNHTRKGGRKKFCLTSLRLTILNRSKQRFILQDLALWAKIGEKTYRFRLFDEERNKWDLHYTLEGRQIYQFFYRCVPEGFISWPGHDDGTIPFTSKDEIRFYLSYRGRKKTNPVDTTCRLRLNPARIAS